MAKGVNKVILIGNCGKDPDTRYMPNGNAVTNISVATAESWTDKQSGQKQERTEWHNVVFFGRLGEIAGEYLKKGSQIYIEGKLKTESYEKDGITRYTTKIIANSMQMLGAKSGSTGSATSAAQNSNQQTNAAQPAAMANDEDFDDDIPF